MKVILAILFAAGVASISGYGHGHGHDADEHRGHGHASHGHDSHGHDSHGHGGHGHGGHRGHDRHGGRFKGEVCDINKKEHKNMCAFVHKMCGTVDNRFVRKQTNGTCGEAKIPEHMKKKRQVCLYDACKNAAVTMEMCKILNMTCHHEIKKLIPLYFIHRGTCGNCSKANLCRWRKHKAEGNLRMVEDNDEEEHDDEISVGMDEDGDEGEHGDEDHLGKGHKKENKIGMDANKSRIRFGMRKRRRGKKICGSDGVEYASYCDYLVGKCQAFKKNMEILYIQRRRYTRGKRAKCTKQEVKDEPEHFFFLRKFVMRKLH